jgi:hypothetical protein
MIRGGSTNEVRRLNQGTSSAVDEAVLDHELAEQVSVPELSDDPTEPPLPSAVETAKAIGRSDDLLSAPRADTIGAPSGANNTSRDTAVKRHKRPVHLAPSRY